MALIPRKTAAQFCGGPLPGAELVRGARRRQGKAPPPFIAALLLLGLGAAPAAAAEPACPPRAPRIRLAVVDKPVQVIHDQSVDALHAQSGLRRTDRRHHLALTTSTVEWQSELNARITRRDGTGPVCAVPGQVVLTLVEAQHRISIASEIPQGGCLWREVLAHERRHAEANRRSLAVAARAARAAATAWAQHASARGATVEAAMARLQAGLRRSIEPSLAEMRAARTAAHAAIDRPAEYRRLAEVCPADQARLAARLRAKAGD